MSYPLVLLPVQESDGSPPRTNLPVPHRAHPPSTKSPPFPFSANLPTVPSRLLQRPELDVSLPTKRALAVSRLTEHARVHALLLCWIPTDAGRQRAIRHSPKYLSSPAFWLTRSFLLFSYFRPVHCIDLAPTGAGRATGMDRAGSRAFERQSDDTISPSRSGEHHFPNRVSTRQVHTPVPGIVRITPPSAMGGVENELDGPQTKALAPFPTGMHSTHIVPTSSTQAGVQSGPDHRLRPQEGERIIPPSRARQTNSRTVDDQPWHVRRTACIGYKLASTADMPENKVYVERLRPRRLLYPTPILLIQGRHHSSDVSWNCDEAKIVLRRCRIERQRAAAYNSGLCTMFYCSFVLT